MPSPISAPGGRRRRRDAEHQLGLLQRPRWPRRRRSGTTTARSPACRPSRAAARRAGSGGPGQQRVDLVLHRLRQRSRHLGRPAPPPAARPAPVADSRTAPRTRRPGRSPAGPRALHVGRVEVRPRRAAPRGTSRAASARSRPRPPPPPPRSAPRWPPCAGTRPPRAARVPAAAPRRAPPARRDRHLRRHLGRTLWAPAGQAGAHVALVSRPPLEGHPQARHDNRHRRARMRGGDLRHPLEPVAGEHGAHHFQVGAARRLRHRVGPHQSQVGLGIPPPP